MSGRPLPSTPASSDGAKPETLYSILGISESASQAEIRKAYKLKALATHPDKLDPKTSRADVQRNIDHFLRIKEAFEVLYDQNRRKEYDLRLKRTPLSFSNRSAQNGGGTNSSSMAEATERRDRDRHKWAQQQKESFESRMSSIRDQRGGRPQPFSASTCFTSPLSSPPKKASPPPPQPSKKSEMLPPLVSSSPPSSHCHPPLPPSRPQTRASTGTLNSVSPPSRESSGSNSSSSETLRADYKAMVDQALAELFMDTPEWEIRKAKLKQRKNPLQTPARNQQQQPSQPQSAAPGVTTKHSQPMKKSRPLPVEPIRS